MVNMKKVICLFAAFALCVNMSVTAFAADFVPSIGVKDGLEVVAAKMDEADVKPCLVVSSTKQAENKTTDISQGDRDLLLSVYQQLTSGAMKLPLESKYVIRDLVDVSFRYNDCRENADHADKAAQLKEEGTTLTVTFKMGVDAKEKISVLVYQETASAARTTQQGQWVPAESVKNNGDGTVTVEFEDICPVAFVVEDTDGPTTGDVAGNQILFLTIAMVASATGIIALVVPKAKKSH